MSDVLYVSAFAALVLGVGILVFAYFGLLPAIGAGLITAAPLMWIEGRLLDGPGNGGVS